jgi:heme/copper-type cytochrome/quinol oxidase subunit 2
MSRPRILTSIAVACMLAACGGGSATTTTAPAATTTAATTTAPMVIEVSVSDGTIAGGGDVSVPKGTDVVLRVTSDVADEVHLHGYDIAVDVEAGETIELPFTADREGVFEVELEDARLPLLEITVQ